MGDRIIGANTDDLHLPVKQALDLCARTGFRAVEIGATAGEITARSLSESGRQHLLRICRGLGLSPAGLTLEPAGPGWSDSSVLDQRVEQAIETLGLAASLKLPIVSARVGPLLGPDGATPSNVAEAIREVADRADRLGVAFAVETGPDAPAELTAGLASMACPSLRVCVDPATLVQFGYDPVEAVGHFAEMIGLSRVADATAGRRGRPGVETSLGRGQLDLPAYLAELAGADYGGPLILRRRDSMQPACELADSLSLLSRMLV